MYFLTLLFFIIKFCKSFYFLMDESNTLTSAHFDDRILFGPLWSETSCSEIDVLRSNVYGVYVLKIPVSFSIFAKKFNCKICLERIILIEFENAKEEGSHGYINTPE
jgi:hypothetical protein